MSRAFHYISHGSSFFTDLVRRTRDGEYVLPVFQRPFIWDEADIIALLDSMWRGYPIGTILLWENWRAQTREVRSFRGCATPLPHACLVLDGQQRIQAMIDATAPGSGYAFELAADRFVRVASPKISDGFVPCEVLTDFVSFMTSFAEEYDRAHPRPAAVTIEAPLTKRGKKRPTVFQPQPPPPPKTPEQEAVTAKIDLAESVLGAFREVRIGSVTIPAECDEAFAREVFRRMNRTGKAFTEADIFGCLGS